MRSTEEEEEEEANNVLHDREKTNWTKATARTNGGQNIVHSDTHPQESIVMHSDSEAGIQRTVYSKYLWLATNKAMSDVKIFCSSRCVWGSLRVQ